MKFRELAKYLQRLEGTSGRLEMTRILAELFKKFTAEDARLIAYLSQGRLGPAYANPDMGVADKMMVRALGEKARGLFKKLGDLGLVAEELKSSRKAGSRSAGQNIKQIYEKLLTIAYASGKDSQEKKQKLIGELISDLDPLGAKYAVKIILGKMRTGFSDMTVLDSLSWMITGDKSLRPKIEAMYNVRADLGEVAKTVKTHGTNRTYGPEIGTPILMARAERATSAAEIWKRNGRCALEYKLDGLRIQAHVAFGAAAASARRPSPSGWHPLRARSAAPACQVKLFSRGLEDVTAMYPDVVQGLQRQIKKDCIVEGEMIAVGKGGWFLPFQKTVQRKRKYQIAEMASKVPLKIYLFDLLLLDKTNMTNKTNVERWGELEKLVGPGETVRLMSRREVRNKAEIDKFFQQALEAGTEGIIAKKLDGPYQAGARDFNWIKYKKSYGQSALSDTIDAVVMGYDVGQGKRAGFGIGDFLIGVYHPRQEKYFTVAKVGTGLTDAEWREMKLKCQNSSVKSKPENYEVKKEMSCDFWVSPKIVVEIMADEITKSPMHTSGYALRFPRLISWREKQPQDTTTIDEMEKIYET